MKHVRTLILALTLTSGAVGSAIADDGEQRHRPWDGDGRGDRDHDDGRWDGDRDDGRWDGDRDGDRWDGDRDGDRWDGGRGPRGHFVPVRFVNHRDQFVTLYLNGRYLGRLAPNSRERITLPVGHHVVTYQVGFRHRYHQVEVSAFHGQRNRVIIEGRRWGGWGRH